MTTTAPNSAASMRQQLDELDALLQRMLSLPDAGDTHGQNGVRPEPEPDLGDAWKSPAMTLLRDSGPVAPPAESPRWDPSWSINLNPQNGSSILGSRSPAADAMPAPMPVQPPEVRAPLPAPVEFAPLPPAADPPPTIAFPQPPLPAPPSPRAEPLPLWAWPFAAIDRLFDAVVQLFPLGSLLTTRIGKNVVGFIGVILLIGGIVWGALDYLGWTR